MALIKAVSAYFLLGHWAQHMLPATSFAPCVGRTTRRLARRGNTLGIGLSSRIPMKMVGGYTEGIESEGREESSPKPLSPKIDNILKDIHSQALSFRIVVIGEGAILETTSLLGPHMTMSTSPTTGERLVTFASDDKSFEFHLKIDKVGKVTFTEKDRQLESGAKKTMRICRFLTDEAMPICSLILADSSPEAADWFRGLTIRYGYEVQAGE